MSYGSYEDRRHDLLLERRREIRAVWTGRAVLKPCLVCARPSRGSRCPEHERPVLRAQWRRGNAIRDPFAREVYASSEWQRLARAVTEAARACHWCHRTPEQLTRDRHSPKLTADHVAPVRLRPDLALEPSNVVAACLSCQAYRRLPRPKGDA